VKTRYKFIHFGKMSDDPEVWICNNNRTGKALGYIEYYKPWRQMCFHPYAGTVFSDECHRDIAHFLGQLLKIGSIKEVNMMRSAINIILVADEGKYDLRFIETNLDNGISVDVGERVECDGAIRWRIKAEDIVSVNIRRADLED